MFELGLKILLSYLIGSISGALVAGRFRGIDIRNEGSGNAGATNALRTHGLAFALIVVLIDVGKGMLAVWAIAPFAGFGVPLLDPRWTASLCGVAAVVGHIFPFWFDFRGGKGGATAIGALAALAPLGLLPVVVVWLTGVLVTGFVGLSTMLAALAVLVFAIAYQPAGPDWPLIFYGAAIAALIVFAHRSNIQRMLSGSESRASVAMFRSRSAQKDPDG